MSEHPGVYIKEELRCRGWSQADLAYVLGVRDKIVSLIITGKQGLSPRMAKAIGAALSLTPISLMRLQSEYLLSKTSEPNDSIHNRIDEINSLKKREGNENHTKMADGSKPSGYTCMYCVKCGERFLRAEYSTWHKGVKPGYFTSRYDCLCPDCLKTKEDGK